MNSDSPNNPNQRITVEIKHKIAVVTLNRAEKHNALDMAMFRAIDSTIKSLQRNKKVQAVIVKGAGEDFCTGLDVKSMLSSAKNGAALLFKWWPFNANLAQRVTLGWRDIPCPVIFAVHGRCWGGGLQIALGGDYRFATPDSNWSIMEGRWGIIPDMGGTVLFPKVMRQDHTLKMAMSAEQISGITAQQLGLVSEVSENPFEDAMTLAKQLVERSPDALAACKKIYNNSWTSSQGMALFRESFYQIKILFGKNQRIAVKKEKERDRMEK
jgi:enoyl-CoA hydratase/carnithine racemase